jgi:hypothetical protein
MSIHLQVNQFTNRYPRVVPGFFFAMGLLATWAAYDTYTAGKPVATEVFMVASLGWGVGFTGLVEPRLGNAFNPAANPPVPRYFQIIAVVLAVAAAVGGIYLSQRLAAQRGPDAPPPDARSPLSQPTKSL